MLEVWKTTFHMQVWKPTFREEMWKSICRQLSRCGKPPLDARSVENHLLYAGVENHLLIGSVENHLSWEDVENHLSWGDVENHPFTLSPHQYPHTCPHTRERRLSSRHTSSTNNHRDSSPESESRGTHAHFPYNSRRHNPVSRNKIIPNKSLEHGKWVQENIGTSWGFPRKIHWYKVIFRPIFPNKWLEHWNLGASHYSCTLNTFDVNESFHWDRNCELLKVLILTKINYLFANYSLQ